MDRCTYRVLIIAPLELKQLLNSIAPGITGNAADAAGDNYPTMASASGEPPATHSICSTFANDVAVAAMDHVVEQGRADGVSYYRWGVDDGLLVVSSSATVGLIGQTWSAKQAFADAGLSIITTDPTA